ncbi:MAG: AhpC/TSA family protein, partial [Luteimonas sp.]|nr:AhpC/TSA family protein [Luteimonas sp.]
MRLHSPKAALAARPLAPLRLALAAATCALVLAACQQEAPASATDSARAGTHAAATKSAGFSLAGDIKDLPDGTKVMIRTLDPKGAPDAPPRVVASTESKDGHFALTGSVDQPLPGVLLVGSHGVINLVVENADYRIDDTGAGLVVRGGTLNDLVFGDLWSPKYIAAKKELAEISRKAFAGVDLTDEAAATAARKKTGPAYGKISELENAYDRTVLDGDAPTLAKLFVLRENTDWKRYDEARRREMLDAYSKELGPHPLIAQMRWVDEVNRKSEQARSELAVGRPYRDITATDVDGKPVRLSEVLARNKLVLLDFWASWCGPCRGEFPHLAKVYKEFHEHGFEIYAVSLDDEVDDWLKALREEQKLNGVPWINLQDAGFE